MGLYIDILNIKLCNSFEIFMLSLCGVVRQLYYLHHLDNDGHLFVNIT